MRTKRIQLQFTMRSVRALYPEKARIRKRAAEHGVTATVQFLSKVFPGCPLKESSVQTWKKTYEVALAKNKKAGS